MGSRRASSKPNINAKYYSGAGSSRFPGEAFDDLDKNKRRTQSKPQFRSSFTGVVPHRGFAYGGGLYGGGGSY